jgi:hypothetical protein
MLKLDSKFLYNTTTQLCYNIVCFYYFSGFPDASAMWLRSYEAADFRDQVSELWDQLKPLYQQLHAYVRRHLRQK